MSIEEIGHLSIKTLLFYFFLLLILKLMGKREIGKVSTFDIVVFFVISELFSLSLNEPKASILHSLIPISIIVILQILSAIISLKNHKIRKIFEGKISFIIYNGEINQEVMKKERYNIDDLFFQLRSKNIQQPDEVMFAILEDNGVLSIIKKDDCILKDPLPLISDGTIDECVLKRVNLSKDDLLILLKKYSYSNYKDIFICLLKLDGGLFIIPKRRFNNK